MSSSDGSNEIPKNPVELEFPFKHKGEQITELKMRRPKVRDQVTVNKQDGSAVDKELTLFANLCGVEPVVIEEVDLKDYGKLQKLYSSFLA